MSESTIPTRRAILAGIPTAAIGVAALPTAALAAPSNETTFDRIIREYFEGETRWRAAVEPWENGEGPWPTELSDACKKLRVAVAQTKPKNFDELRKKAAVAFDVGGSHFEDDMASDLATGEAYSTTLAYSLLRDFVNLYGVSSELPPPV